MAKLEVKTGDKTLVLDTSKLSKQEIEYINEYKQIIQKRKDELYKEQKDVNLDIIKPVKYFWDKAKKYIIEQSEYLEKNEPLYYIDKKFAYACIKVASTMKHTAGKLENKNFQLSDWQIKAIVDIFGTKYRFGKYEGLRRYQRVLFHMPKKNGKTETGALFHLIMFFLEDSLSKEQYCIASDKDQAVILHDAITTMIKSNDFGIEDDIKKITIQPPRITKTDESGVYNQTITSLAKPLGDSKDGKKVTFFTSDEGHAQETKNLYQLVKNGMALVDEPLEINLSTSGYNLQGYYYTDIYSYACKVRDGIIEDKRFYYVIFELEESDYKDEEGNEIPDFWKDKKLWAKVNPNIGVSPTYSFLEGLVSEAENSEESRIAFLTKHLNMWCDKPSVWIKHGVWSSGQTPIDREKLKGRACYAGLDLATIWDLAALVLIFPDEENGSFDVLCRFWSPASNMRERSQRDKVPYSQWDREGLITATTAYGGVAIDLDTIYNDIMIDCLDFDVKYLAYDRYRANDLITKLEESEATECIPYSQTPAMFNAPIEEIERLCMQNKLNHGNNKILSWHCSNVVLLKDSNDNKKFDKKKSAEKIDGIVALGMAFGVYLVDKKEEEEIPIYEKRGMRILE